MIFPFISSFVYKLSLYIVWQVDPDVIVGHDLAGYDLDVLLHRIAAGKISNWSKLGRLKRATVPKFGARSGAAAGRLIMDTMISAKELIRCRSYDLTEVTDLLLLENPKFSQKALLDFSRFSRFLCTLKIGASFKMEEKIYVLFFMSHCFC